MEHDGTATEPDEVVRLFVVEARQIAGSGSALARALVSSLGYEPDAQTINSWTQKKRGPGPRRIPPGALVAMLRAYPDRLSFDEAALAGTGHESLAERFRRLEFIVSRLQTGLDETRQGIKLPPVEFAEGT